MDLLDWFIERESEKNSMELCISKQLFFLYEVYSGFFWKKDWVTTVFKKLVIKEEWRSLISNSGWKWFLTVRMRTFEPKRDSSILNVSR